MTLSNPDFNGLLNGPLSKQYSGTATVDDREFADRLTDWVDCWINEPALTETHLLRGRPPSYHETASQVGLLAKHYQAPPEANAFSLLELERPRITVIDETNPHGRREISQN